MSRRHKPVVILLTVEDFAVLEASAREHGRDVYLHAQWLLTRALWLEMSRDPARTDTAEAES